MDSVQSQVAAAVTERDRIEAVVWIRNPSVERQTALLRYLMTQQEWLHWRAIVTVIAEMRKHL